MILGRSVCIIDEVVDTINANANQFVTDLAVPLVLTSRITREVFDHDPVLQILLRFDWLQRLDEELGVATCLEQTIAAVLLS